MKTNKSSDEPLLVQVAGGKLIISIGVNTFAFAQHYVIQNEDYGKTETVIITQPDVFAKDVEYELDREREDGSTLLTDLLDLASRRAIENGSIGVKYVKKKEWETVDYTPKGKPK